MEKMNEIWFPVVGYEGLYDVSNIGQVRSLNYNKTGKTKILKPAKHRQGYLFVTLCRNGKQKRFLVHRLVAQAFIPNPDNLPQVNHKNEIKDDNRVENLEYCTAKYNNEYSGVIEKARKAAHSKQSWKIVIEKRKKPVLQYSKTGELINEYESAQDAGKQTGIYQGNICSCCLNKRKSAGGYIWRFKTYYYFLLPLLS